MKRRYRSLSFWKLFFAICIIGGSLLRCGIVFDQEYSLSGEDRSFFSNSLYFPQSAKIYENLTDSVITNFTTGLTDARALEEINGYLYVLDQYTGVHIFDVSKPNETFSVSNITLESSGYGIDIFDNRIYIATGEGMLIYNIINPSNPTYLGRFDDGGVVYDVDVYNSIAYLADISDGLEIINITDPAHPSKIADIEPSAGNARTIMLHPSNEDYVLLGCVNGGGVQIIDVSNPYLPIIINSVGGSFLIWDIEFFKDFALIS